MIPTYTLLIRRDAHTSTPATVPAYEVPILQTIFGEESVLNADGKLIKDGLGEPVGTFAPGEDEYERLSRRYQGNDKGPFIEQVYGLKATGKLDDAIERAKPKAKK
jgi:hypothetical protein